ncbi:hypothetical protein WJX74_004268 [Apatococcus lobatus]|uniref:Uncharacterized protein n=1 Tax=Apatococcus lobatus TaxID=904363 RepID=A0AAW1QYQ9_9CHLO
MLAFTLEQHSCRLISGSSCAVLARLPPRLRSTRTGWTSRRFSKLQTFMAAQETPHETKSSKRLSWYQKLGQSVNPSGISMFGRVFLREQKWAIPHLDVQDLRSINWHALRAAGFSACAFDKDNTLTRPYDMVIYPPIAKALADCQREFNGRAVIVSNSAGLAEFDPEGKEAAAVEAALGVPVLRHAEKKPGGSAESLTTYFGCDASEVLMIGDRYLTDVVYGNRNGLFTVRTKPFDLNGEPSSVLWARRLEEKLVKRWRGKGQQAPMQSVLLKTGLSTECFKKTPDAPHS